METLRIRQATKKGYIEVKEGGVFDGSYPTSRTRRGRVIESGTICPTLMANEQEIYLFEGVSDIEK